MSRSALNNGVPVQAGGDFLQQDWVE